MCIYRELGDSDGLRRIGDQLQWLGDSVDPPASLRQIQRSYVALRARSR
jgi:hypothetical protein